MGISYNDRIKIGKYSFDLQTEVKGNLIIGEIIHAGRVLKSIKKERDPSVPETTDVYNVHNYLKQLLIEKIASTSTKTKTDKKDKKLDKTKILYNTKAIKIKLAKLLELDEHNLEFFSYRSKKLEITSFSNKNLATKIEDLLNELENVLKKTPKFKTFKSLIYIFKQNNKKTFIAIINYKNSKVIFAFSNIKLSFIRKNINNIPSILPKILNGVENGTY